MATQGTAAARRPSSLQRLALWLALCLLTALPAAAQSGSGARLLMVARRLRHARGKAAPAVSRAQMELAHQMVRDAYALGQALPLRQRVALMTRLLYTLRPEVMAAEKRQWAEELFGLAQQLPPLGSAAPATPPEAASAPEIGQRETAIATAAARLALYDSDRALQLLDTLPSQGGRRQDARTMASRLLFPIYLQHHGAAGAQTLLAHARQWGEHGGFPYRASAAALARLGADEDATEEYFRQELALFARGQEGVYGVREFAGLLDRAVAMEAISDDSAEEAGRAVVAQLLKLTGLAPAGSEAAANGAASNDAASNDAASNDAASNDAAGPASSNAALQPEPPPSGSPLPDDEARQVAEALNDLRLSAPRAYAQAAKEWPALLALHPPPLATPLEELQVDASLQASFAELAETIQQRRRPEALRKVTARALQLLNARYQPAACAACVPPDAGADGNALSRSGRWRLAPDAQSWALVSLAAYASPMTIAVQLKAIEEPFWHAYFLAIAAQQVGEPTRVADPTARRLPGKEEAEPE